MSLTIRDCCNLPSLQRASVIAGKQGLEKTVDSVSVLEWIDLDSPQPQFFLQNEIVITSLYSVKDDVDKQVRVIRRLHESGEIGMILYYVGMIVPDVDPRLLQVADELEFPILLMPPYEMNFRYSEAIREISEQIQKRIVDEPDFVKHILDRLARVPEQYRSISTVLRVLSDHLKVTLVLADRHFAEYRAATWPLSSPLKIREFLQHYGKTEQSFEGYTVQGAVPARIEKWPEAKLLAITTPEHPGRSDLLQDAAGIVELIGRLWKNFESDSFSAELIRAVLGREVQRAQELLRSEGIREDHYCKLWVIEPRDTAGTHRELSARLSADLKALRQTLGERDAQLTLVDDKIVGLAGETADLRETLQSVGSALFAAEIAGIRSPDAFAEPYGLTRRCLPLAKKVYPAVSLVGLHELRCMEDLLNLMERGERQMERTLSVLAPVLHSRTSIKDELLRTLQVLLIDSGGDIADASAKLFVHMNTVRYRIAKLEELLGFPLSRFPQVNQLYQAAILLRATEKQPAN